MARGSSAASVSLYHTNREPDTGECAHEWAERSSLSHGGTGLVQVWCGGTVLPWYGPAPALSRGASLDDLKIVATHR